MFAFRWFSISLALAPNLKVDNVYSYYDPVGVIHSSIRVLEFPPRLDFRILVRGEFRYGIC